MWKTFYPDRLRVLTIANILNRQIASKIIEPVQVIPGEDENPQDDKVSFSMSEAEL